MVATGDVNRSIGVAIDIVFVFDETLASQLVRYPARQWFALRPQLELQHPGKLAIFNYELVPESQQRLFPGKNRSKFPKAHRSAKLVMVYANYILQDANSTADITAFKTPLITLEFDTISVVEKSGL